MDFKNIMLKLILKYMDEKGIASEQFSCEDAWELASRMAKIAKLKDRKEILPNPSLS